jgi:O-antigen ligase
MTNPDLLAALVSAERRSPTLMAWTAIIAAGWCLCLGVSRSVEGVFFAGLLVATLLGVRSFASIWWAMLRTLPALCLTIWVSIHIAVSLSRLPIEAWPLALPGRQFLVPLLLAPAIHRWRLLLAAFAFGTLARAPISLFDSYQAIRDGIPLSRADINSGAFLLAPLFVGGLAMLASRRARTIAGGAVAVSLAALAISLSSQRGMMVSAAVGGLSFLAIRFRRSRLVVAGASATLVAALAAGALGLVAWIGDRPIEEAARELNVLSGSRLCMWEATLHLSMGRPLLGHGAGCWRTDAMAMLHSEPDRWECLAAVEQHPEVRYCHNTMLDVLHQTGLVGLSIGLGAIAWGLRDAWRRLDQEPVMGAAIAMLVATLVAAQFDHMLARGISCGVFMLLFMIVLIPRPNQHDFARSGLGVADDWVDGLLGTRPS